MCFRPSALHDAKQNNVQYATCPSCGQPVAANAGVTSGNCPHCGKPIPQDPTTTGNVSASDHNVRIL